MDQREKVNSAPLDSFMKRPFQLISLLFLLVSIAIGIVVLRTESIAKPVPAATSGPAIDANSEIAALKAEIDQLKGKVPDQSHAMKDVGYHFANVWFAGQKRNWPLAKFYLDETRSHLKWADHGR